MAFDEGTTDAEPGSDLWLAAIATLFHKLIKHTKVGCPEVGASLASG